MEFEDLVRQAAQDLFEGTAIVFLGAGASMGNPTRDEGKGVPGSGTLTKELIGRFGLDTKDANTLKRTASLAVRKRDASTVKKVVVDQIRPHCGTPLTAHRALARIAPRIVMTTNYDDLYEAAMREAGKPLEKVVRPEQLARLPHDRRRVLKLHGDVEGPDGIVLTGTDYRRWQSEAGGLKASVVATLQESACIFVGYGVGDENLHDILGIIEANQRASSLKHFALVRDVDDGLASEWNGTVEFVRGDATEFFERVAEEYEALETRSVDPATERLNFEEHLRSGRLSAAAETCEKLVGHLEKRGERATASSLWRSFGEAARDAGAHGAAASAFSKAGRLLLDTGDPLEAEPLLSSAISEADAAEEPLVRREALPFLQSARLLAGMYDEVLRDTQQALATLGDDAPTSLTYSLRTARAEAREATESKDGTQEELEAVLRELPPDALYFRVRAAASLARVLADEFDWDKAHDVLNNVDAEIANSKGRVDGKEIARCAAIQKLVRANVHRALGEDAYAAMHYRECAPVLEESGEVGLAVSALQGIIMSAPFLGYLAEDDTTDRLKDLGRSSAEHRRCTDLQREGIEYLANYKLAASRNSLIKAEAAANALHSPIRPRSISGWFADVLLEAGFLAQALIGYAGVGDRDKVKKVLVSLRQKPPREGDAALPVDRLLRLAKDGPLHARGTALVALQGLWDVLPEGLLPEIAELLSGLTDMPNIGWADRNVLPDAADLARRLAPRFDEDQTERVYAAVVAAIEKDDVLWTSHKAACLALGPLAAYHPGVAEKLGVPTDRLAELVGGHPFDDRVKSLMALVNVGLSGHAEARAKALEVLENADPYTSASWRQILGEATAEELESAVRLLLPQSVPRAKRKGNVTRYSAAPFNPLFIKDWDLPASVRPVVARTLAEAVGDPGVGLYSRQASALALGYRAAQFGPRERKLIVEALKTILTQDFDSEPILLSMDNPLSMLRTSVGQPDDVIAAAAEALLAFSPWIDDGERRYLMEEIEQLRASQIETLGIGVADGLKDFTPRNAEEKRWLTNRLLLLLNSHHFKVRQGAARSFAKLVEREVATFDGELLATMIYLSKADTVSDRAAAATALRAMSRSPVWNRKQITDVLEVLREDASYLVKRELTDKTT